ncbi:MAG: thermonuclease family protein [Pseudomonadota bacterium]
MRAILLAALAAGLFASTAEARILYGQAEVIDGDSVRVDGVEVRLHGMDAPELGQICHRDGEPWDCGEEARQALVALVEGKTLSCRRTIYSAAYVGDCRVEGEIVSAMMLSDGWAVVDRRGPRRYVGFESEARRAGVNLWAGEFDSPWEWRKDNSGAKGGQIVLFDQRVIAP